MTRVPLAVFAIVTWRDTSPDVFFAISHEFRMDQSFIVKRTLHTRRNSRRTQIMSTLRLKAWLHGDWRTEPTRASEVCSNAHDHVSKLTALNCVYKLDVTCVGKQVRRWNPSFHFQQELRRHPGQAPCDKISRYATAATILSYCIIADHCHEGMLKAQTEL
ncbi:hypothetical protein C2E23DRAFT_800252 [Lenzites betulinus]|nr:hypothetical protein C2E23DRAFT_800252 [Lenzites betulinus]